MRRLLILVTLLLCACTGVPKGITPVSHFALEPYLGVWHEIARLDHSYERGLSNVSAEYTLRDDGGVQVRNRGFDEGEGEWREAIGRAYFTGDTDVGHLKVSFFGPFYGSYVIFTLDREAYQYAFVTSYNRESLWFLSRTRTVSDELYRRFLDEAKALGFDTSELIRVDQSLVE